MNINELTKSEMKSISGGGPIFEFIAWLYGVAEAKLLNMSCEMDYDDVDWEKMRSLYE